MKKIWIFLLLTLLFSSCQEEVVLDLDQKESRIPVIEGHWTDQVCLQ
jgi:hypothetical protein